MDDVPATPPNAKPSPWEWLPVAALAALAVWYLHGGGASRFAFFVGLGLVPGTLWRLAGRSAWNVHRVGFALGLTAFVLDNPGLRPDDQTWGRMLDAWPLVAAGFLVSFTQSYWGALRTRRLLTDSGVSVTFLETLKLCLCGSFFNIILPGSTGGDAYRIFAVARGYQTRLGPAIASITLDRFLGFPALILVVAMGVALDHGFFLANPLLLRLAPFIAVSGAVCLVLVLYLVWAGWHGRRTGGAGAVGEPAVKVGWLRRIHVLLSNNVTRPATLPFVLFYGFMSHLSCIGACLLFGIALGVEGVPPLRYLLIVPMAMTINAIPFAPGGVGQGELAMASLIELAAPVAGNAQAGVMVMFLFRLSNLVVGLVGGALYAAGRGGARPATEECRLASRESGRLSAGLAADDDAS